MIILQLNLNHCEAAQELLKQTVRDINADIAILSEPYKNQETPNWISDIDNTTAIWSVSRNTMLNVNTAHCGFTRATISGITIYSCYIPPRYSIEEFQGVIDNIVADAIPRSPVLIAGDFNAWAIEWGCPRTNARGRILLESLSVVDVVLMNEGTKQTFSRGGHGSIIDLTFASSSIAGQIEWRVSDYYTHSDHFAITIDIAHALQPANVRFSKPIGWKVDTLDKDVFRVAIEDMNLSGPPETMSKQFVQKISKACDVSMVRRKNGINKPRVYWWNEEIAQLRSQCIQARRKYTRSHGRPENPNHRQTFKVKRKLLKRAIRKSKRNCFLDICDDLQENPWGLAYKLVTKKLKVLNPEPPKEASVLREIVEHLFPKQQSASWEQNTFEEVYNYRPVLNSEIEQAISKLKDKKAPGLDGIPNLVLKDAFKCCPDQFAAMINGCLRHGVFPSIWKRQKLVLLPKGKKPLDDPSSYRPLCMIDTAGKLLESIICKRLEEYIEATEGLSCNQYGFRKGRSTVDAIRKVVDIASNAIDGKSWKRGSKEYCVVVTLDVKNAFNSANWEIIVNSLARLGVPPYLLAIIKDYFRNRTLVYETESGMKDYNVTGGVPQGSVLGPLLWNVMYDGVLKLKLPERAKIIGFADDIALVCVAKQLEEAEIVTNSCIRIVRSWLTSVGLTLADHKTEAVLISSRTAKETIKLDTGSCYIETKPCLKYLGVMIDCRLSFKDHLLYTSEKASKTCASLSRIMPNTRGPKYLQRKLLTGAVKSTITYASPIWADSLENKANSNQISRVYRISALRVCCAFRTVSDDAAFVIAGMIPIDILVRECNYTPANVIDHVSTLNTARCNSLIEWQRRWSTSNKGRWTYELIPNIKDWFERKHGDLNFYLTQMLSGHGCFRSYLYRFNHDSDPYCPYCGVTVEEDAKHVFFFCPRFGNERTSLERSVGCIITAGNVIEIMLVSLYNWENVCKFVKFVLLELRKQEELRRRLERTSGLSA